MTNFSRMTNRNLLPVAADSTAASGILTAWQCVPQSASGLRLRG